MSEPLSAKDEAAAPSRGPRPFPAAPPAARPKRNLLLRYLARFDDAEVVRWAFRGLLAGAVAVLAMDLNELRQRDRWSAPPASAPGVAAPAVLPPAAEPGGEPGAGRDPRPFLPDDEAALRRPMRFTLGKGGVLLAQGLIDVGTADRLKAEIEARGEYVKVVALDSPGGSLGDAMAMARLLRERGLATRVEDGALCASSCPLVMAGGASRAAGPKAAVGLHQFYAPDADRPAPGNPAQAMSDAQSTTAAITRLLAEMNVDPALWLHALDTPPRALYYLSPAEMAEYRLVTEPAPVAQAGSGS